MLRSLQTNFASGQLSEKLMGRAKDGVYQNGAREILNGLLMMQGGVTRRPGTMALSQMVDASRIEGRIYSRNAAYVLAFSAFRLDIYALDGALVQSLVGQPWDGSTVPFLTLREFGALTVICDQSFAPLVLVRSAAGWFSIATFSFDLDADGVPLEPRTKFADEAVTLAPSAVSGAITLTASAPVFEPEHVGLTLSIAGAFATITSYTAATLVSATLIGRLLRGFDPAPFSVIKASSTVTVTLVDHALLAGQSVTIANTAVVGQKPDLTGGILMDGVHTVANVIDADHFTITAAAAADDSEDGGGSAATITTTAPVRAWKEPIFSAVRGWPQACAFYNGRLWFAGTESLGDAVMGSRPVSFFDFAAGKGDPDDAVVAIAQTQSNAIRHLVAADDLLVFGDSGEASFPPNADVGITQGTVRGKPATKIGASYSAPQTHDGTVMFADVMGQHIYEFSYVEGIAAYVATPLSALAPELIRKPLYSTVYKGSASLSAPYVMWAMEDRSIAVLASRRAEKALGWTQIATSGGFVSVCGVNERLFFCARRVVAGIPEFWLEEADWSGLARSDSCRVMAPIAGTRIFIDCPLGPGRIVDVFDATTGAYIERAITDNNAGFSLSSDVTIALVGLPFSFRVETLPPQATVATGDTLGTVQRIVSSTIQFHETGYAKVDGVAVVGRRADDVTGVAPLLSGFIKAGQLGWRRGPTVVVESDVPEPLTILSILTEVAG